MSSQLYNNVTDYLAAGVAASDTTISVADGSKFTDPGQGNYTPLYLIRTSDGAHEIVHITAASGNDLTVTRSEEGTDPMVFNSGDMVQIRPTRQSLLDMNGNVKTSTGEQSISDALDRRVIYVGSVAEGLVGLTGIDDASYRVSGWYPGQELGGQNLVFRANEPKSNHGITGWSPTVPGVSAQPGASLAERRDSFLSGAGETDPSGSGLFVFDTSELTLEMFGYCENARITQGLVDSLLGASKTIKSNSAVLQFDDSIVIAENDVHIIAKESILTPSSAYDHTGKNALLKITGDDCGVDVKGFDCNNVDIGALLVEGCSGFSLEGPTSLSRLGGQDYDKEGIRFELVEDYNIGSIFVKGPHTSAIISNAIRIRRSYGNIESVISEGLLGTKLLSLIQCYDTNVGRVVELESQLVALYVAYRPVHRDENHIVVDSVFVRGQANSTISQSGLKLSRGANNVTLRHVDIETGPAPDHGWPVLFQGVSNCKILDGRVLRIRESTETWGRAAVEIQSHPTENEDANSNYIRCKVGVRSLSGGPTGWGCRVLARESWDFSTIGVLLNANYNTISTTPIDETDPNESSAVNISTSGTTGPLIGNTVKDAFCVTRSTDQTSASLRQAITVGNSHVENCSAYSAAPNVPAISGGVIVNSKAKSGITETGTIQGQVVAKCLTNPAGTEGALQDLDNTIISQLFDYLD